MNIVLVRTPKGIRYAEIIRRALLHRGAACFIAEAAALRGMLRENHLEPRDTLIHFRTAGPRVNVLNAELAQEGFRVLNSARTLHLTSHKYASQVHAREHGIPVAETFLIPKKNLPAIQELVSRFNTMVVKPIWSQGQGVYCQKIERSMEIEQLAQIVDSVPGEEIQVQGYIPARKLIRVVVIGYRALPEAVTYDEPRESWKCSVCLNPRIKKYENPDPQLLELAEKTARAFGAHINYIDFFETRDGAFILNEINTACSLSLHEEVSGCKIHQYIGDYLIAQARATEKMAHSAG